MPSAPWFASSDRLQQSIVAPRGDAPLRDVKGKVAVITGGSSGIGLGIARAFTDAGMKVVIGYRTREHLDHAMTCLDSAAGRVHAINVDVTDRDGMKRAAQESVDVFGKIHVLVSNAGVVLPAPLSNMTYDEWDWLMNVNLNGVFNSLRAFLPHIWSHAEGGQVVATASILGLLVLGGEEGGYAASKFAVVGMMEALRAELATRNVGVSVFCPGLVTSNIIDCDRNRPSTLTTTASRPDARLIAQERAARNDPELAMDPFEAGRLLLRGIQRNDLYVLTHPEFEPLLRCRHEALTASIPTDLRPTNLRSQIARSLLQRSIYASQCDSGTRDQDG